MGRGCEGKEGQRGKGRRHPGTAAQRRRPQPGGRRRRATDGRRKIGAAAQCHRRVESEPESFGSFAEVRARDVDCEERQSRLLEQEGGDFYREKTGELSDSTPTSHGPRCRLLLLLLFVCACLQDRDLVYYTSEARQESQPKRRRQGRVFSRGGRASRGGSFCSAQRPCRDIGP